jgi:hypothetical protein
MRGVGWREGTKRDFSTAQADSFADERGEKASACFGRNDRWALTFGKQAWVGRSLGTGAETRRELAEFLRARGEARLNFW